MRITGGKARGIPLKTGKARHVRPATDRMREAVFSSLGEQVCGARFLDLFAGSGSYGLEALSRGAAGGLFVEIHPQAVQSLEENLASVKKSLGMGADWPVKVIRRDVLRFETREKYALVFLDPPYELARTHGRLLLDTVSRWLDPDAAPLVIFELPADLAPPEGWFIRKRIGKTGTNEPSVLLLEPVAQ